MIPHPESHCERYREAMSRVIHSTPVVVPRSEHLQMLVEELELCRTRYGFTRTETVVQLHVGCPAIAIAYSQFDWEAWDEAL